MQHNRLPLRPTHHRPDRLVSRYLNTELDTCAAARHGQGAAQGAQRTRGRPGSRHAQAGLAAVAQAAGKAASGHCCTAQQHC